MRGLSGGWRFLRTRQDLWAEHGRIDLAVDTFERTGTNSKPIVLPSVASLAADNP